MSRQTPVISEVDVLVVGGSAAGVELAVAAKQAGASVYVVSGRSHLGETMCAAGQYWLADGEQATSPVAQKVFTDRLAEAGSPVRPMHVKIALDQALVDADIPFLLNSYPTGVVRTAEGAVAGIALGNRAGRQIIRAKRVIDTTATGLVAQLAGCEVQDKPTGKQVVEHVAFYLQEPGREPEDILSSEALKPFQARMGEDKYEVFARRYELEVDVKDGSAEDLARAYAEVVERCWLPGEHWHSEILTLKSPGYFKQVVDSASEANGVAEYEIRPGLLVLSRLSPVAEKMRHELSRPVRAMALGESFGKQLAADLKGEALGDIEQITCAGSEPLSVCEIATLTDALRPGMQAEQQVEESLDALPRLGQYDVVVVGGGTGGIPAAIGAARAGASVGLFEATSGLGGVGTMGQIAKYYFGNRVGFTSEVDAGVNELEVDQRLREAKGSWSVGAKRAWYHREALKQDVSLWFNAICCGVWVEGKVVKGVVIAGPYGFGLVEAGCVVDATGCADIPAAAGAETIGIGSEHVAVQGTGLTGIVPGKEYNNTDHSFSDDTDVLDATAFFVSSRLKFKHQFDAGQLVDSRERRQIVGDMTLQPADFLYERRFPDTICVSSSNFDTHGFTVYPLFFVAIPGHKQTLWVDVPYRCFLPKEWDRVMACGLGLSAQRDALPVVRMQPDVQNHGYALGRAAAEVAKKNIATRDVDLKALQQHLVEIGNLPERVLSDEDNFPVDDATLQLAIEEKWDEFEGLSLVFSEPERAVKMLREQFPKSQGDQQLRYAQLLALLNEQDGVRVLIDAIRASTWDDGWNYRGMGQFGWSISQVDALLIALGYAGDARGWDAVVEKIESLPDEPDFSHCRALTEVCERLARVEPHARTAQALAEVLRRPGMSGHAQPSIQAMQAALTDESNETAVRNVALRELHLARALYRCGDIDGLGRSTLQAYSQDLRGHFARHARAILAEKPAPVLAESVS